MLNADHAMTGALRDAVQASLQDAAIETAAILGAATPGIVGLISAHLPETARLVLVEPDGGLLARGIGEIAPERRKILRGTGIALHDLRLDASTADAILEQIKPRDAEAFAAARRAIEAMAAAEPMIRADSQDLVVLDMAVNRLHPSQTAACLAEAFRALRRGGRLVMTVLLADEAASWPATTPCLPLETEITAALDRTGFHGMDYSWREDRAAASQGQAEARRFLVRAFKGKQGPCIDQGHAVIYRGPFREALDDDGHLYVRGERTAVCSKTYEVLSRPPYSDFFIGLPSLSAPSLDQAPPFDCTTPHLRPPSVTKGLTGLGP